MGKRTRLKKYDPYPADAIDEAINRWIKHHLQRKILRYILVHGYTYQETADLIAKDTGIIYDAKKMQRAIEDAENKLFPHLKIEYPQYDK